MKTEIFEIKTGNSEQTISSLRKELKAAKSDIANLTVGTEEYNQAVQHAADITDKLGDIQQLVQRSSTGLAGKMASVGNVLAGVSGATNAVIGTMSLLGIKDDELNKKLNQSITALIGVTQGLSALTPAGKAIKELTVWTKAATAGFNGMQKALLGTGIGALVIAVGSLIAYKDEISEFFGGAKSSAEDASDAIDNVVTSMQKLDMAIANRNKSGDIYIDLTNVIEQYDKQQKQSSEQMKQRIQEEIDLQNQVIEKSKERIETAKKERSEDKITELDLINLIKVEGKVQDEAYAKISILTRGRNIYNEVLKDTIKNQNGLNNAIKDTSGIDQVTKMLKLLEGSIQSTEASKVRNWLNAMFQDENGNPLIEKQIEFLQKFKGNWAGLVQYINENPIKIDQLKNLRTELQNALPTDDQIVRKWLDQAFVDENGKPLLEAQIQFLNAWTGSYEDLVAYVKNNPVVFKVQVPKEAKVDRIMGGIVGAIEDAQWKITRGFYVTTGSIRNTADALMSLTSIMDKSSDSYKAFYISSVIMSTAAGIAETWFAVMHDQSLPMMWMKIATGATTSAALLANGIAQIANIKKDTLSNQANVGGSSAIPDVSTTAIQESNWRGGEYQVYVTETDITSTQNKVRVIEANSRF